MRFAVDQCQQSSREQLCRWIDWRFVTPTTAATATIFGIGISAGDSHRSRSISADCQCDADVKSTATRTRTQWWRCFRRKFFSTWHKLATKMRHQRDWFCAVRIFSHWMFVNSFLPNSLVAFQKTGRTICSNTAVSNTRLKAVTVFANTKRTSWQHGIWLLNVYNIL